MLLTSAEQPVSNTLARKLKKWTASQGSQMRLVMAEEPASCCLTRPYKNDRELDWAFPRIRTVVISRPLCAWGFVADMGLSPIAVIFMSSGLICFMTCVFNSSQNLAILCQVLNLAQPPKQFLTRSFFRVVNTARHYSLQQSVAFYSSILFISVIFVPFSS